MTQNMGTADRTIRTLLGLVVAVLYSAGQISGTLALVLGVFATAFVLTSVVGWCPVYSALSFSTRKPLTTGAPVSLVRE